MIVKPQQQQKNKLKQTTTSLDVWESLIIRHEHVAFQ